METEQQKPDYAIAADELAAIIARRGITLRHAAHPDTDYGEDGSLRFVCSLADRENGLACEWTAGSGVPLSTYVAAPWRMALPFADTKRAVQSARAFRPGIAEIAERQAIRKTWSGPTAADVLAALLSDDSCIEGHADWLDWAEEFGYQKADELRKAREAFQTINGRRADLRRLLGADFDAARDAAGRL